MFLWKLWLSCLKKLYGLCKSFEWQHPGGMGVGGERQGGEGQSVCACFAFIEAHDLNVPSFDSTHSQSHWGRSQVERGSLWHQSQRRYKRTHTHTNMREFSSCTAMHQFNILHFKNTHLKQSFSVWLCRVYKYTHTHTFHTQPLVRCTDAIQVSGFHSNWSSWPSVLPVNSFESSNII